MKARVGPELINVITCSYRANIPVLLIGGHGTGKSESLKQVAKGLGIDFVVRDLSLMEPPDLTGMPQIEKGRTVYAPPAFLPTAGKGLLVFEELNRSEKYMMAPCLQLLTERKLNDYSLPDGWLPAAAINPMQEGYDVTELDAALLSRFCCIECEADPGEWLKWASDNDIHPAVRRYVERTADVFKSSNPRSWSMVSKIISAYEQGGSNYTRKTFQLATAGTLGTVHGAAFVRTYLACDQEYVDVSPETVLRRFAEVEAQIKKWKRTRKTDELSAAAREMMCYLQHGDHAEKVRRSKKQRASLEKFIALLPADLAKEVRQAAKDGGVI